MNYSCYATAMPVPTPSQASIYWGRWGRSFYPKLFSFYACIFLGNCLTSCLVALKALCHYIVPSVTKNSKSAILRAPQNGGKSLTSAHELVYAIAYSLVGISVIVESGLKRRNFSTEEKKRSSAVGRFRTLEALSRSSF